jgi:hypothetical protein
MSKLKSFLLASAIACTSFIGAVEPAKAGTCWYIPPSGASVSGDWCRTSLRFIDGLQVWFVTDGNGDLHRFTFWQDGTVTHVDPSDNSHLYEWETDNDGAYRVFFDDGFEFVFIGD